MTATATDNKQTEQMKQFLYRELTEAECDKLEERFFEDSDFFTDLMILEDDLVDKYVRGEMHGAELGRFEKSLPKFPERQTKIYNSRALQRHIAETAPQIVPEREIIAVGQGFWQKISGFFQLPVLQYSMAGLLIAMTAGAGFLLYQNNQVRQDLADLREREIKNQQNEKELADIRQRETEALQRFNELQAKTETQSSELEKAKADLQKISDEKQAKNDETRKLQLEIAELNRKLEQRRELPRQPDTPRQPENKSPILAFNIVPTGPGGSRGGTGIDVKSVTTRGAQIAKVTAQLPTDKEYTVYEIVSGGKIIQSGSLKTGAESLSFDLPPQNTEFKIVLREESPRGGNKELGPYKLQVRKKKRK